MDIDSNIDWLAVAVSNSDVRMGIAIHRLKSLNNPSIYSKLLHCPLKNSTWYTIKMLLKINKCKVDVFIPICSCLSMKMAAVLSLPEIKPNCML